MRPCGDVRALGAVTSALAVVAVWSGCGSSEARIAWPGDEAYPPARPSYGRAPCPALPPTEGDPAAEQLPGTCELWSDAPPAQLAPLQVTLRPDSTRIHLVRARVSIDGVRVMEHGDDGPSAWGDAAGALSTVTSLGLVTPGEHTIHTELTYVGLYVDGTCSSSRFRVRHARPITVESTGARVRIRAGEEGEAFFHEVRPAVVLELESSARP